MNEKPQSSKAVIAGYALLWLFFVYLYIQILTFNQGDIANPILAGMYLVQFGVHEISHLIFSFLPAVFAAAAGSFSELAFTSLIVVAAVRAKSYWSVAFGMLWTMLACMSMGNYMADAALQQMPLLGPGPDVVHDWNFVFGQLGWLDAAEAIGSAVKVIGGIIGAGGLLIGLMRLIELYRCR